MNIIIIGGGICGTSAAEEARRRAPDASITIIGEEPHALYSRVLLPKYVTGALPRERMFLKSREWYEQQNIALLHDTVVTLNASAHTLTTASGATHTYDRLLIAGGGTVNRLPYSSHPHAFHFQTLADANRLVAFLRDRRGRPTVARIAGGSFIGMEFVDVFRHAGFETHLHLKENRLFERTFDTTQSARVEAHLHERGVTVHTQDPIADFDGEQAQTTSGACACDALGIGVGIRVDMPWAVDAGVLQRDGVVVNEFLETGVSHIYAAGDCAEFYDVVTARAYRLGNWMNATLQGRHAARIMLGDRAPFRLVSSYATTVLGMHIVAVGDAIASAANTVIVRESPHGRTLIFVRAGRLVGASLVGDVRERGIITALINARAGAAPNTSRYANPSFDLTKLLPSHAK